MGKPHFSFADEIIYFTFRIRDLIHQRVEQLNRRYDHIKIRKTAKECGEGLKVKKFKSKVTPHTYLGKGVCFNGMKILGGGTVRIGNYFHSGEYCRILSENHNYNSKESIPYDSKYIYKSVIIGDCVWFGSSVTVMPGVTIGDGAIIQNGSTVVSDIPACAIAGGHPAKVFSYRDKNLFYKLMNEGKFK